MRFFYLLPLLSITLFAAIPAESILEIYTNTSFLKQKFNVGSGSFSTTVPSFVTLEGLQLKTPCTIEEKKLTKALDIDDALQSKITEATRIKESLERDKAVLLAKYTLLTTLKLDKTALENIASTTQTFGDLIASNLETQASLQSQIDKATEDLRELLKKRDSFQSKTLTLALTCKGPAELETFFPLQGLNAQKLIRFDAFTQEKSLTISQSAFIHHGLGEDLKNVSLRLYSFAFNRFVTPLPFQPYYIDVTPPQESRVMAKNLMMDATAESTALTAPAQEMFLSTKRVWEAHRVTLPTGEKTEVLFNTQELPASFDTEVDGYGTTFAYAKVDFTPKESIEAGNAKFILDGILIAQKYQPSLIKEKKTHLFFGQNDHIHVAKELVKDYTNETLFGGKQTTEKLWNYTITNRSVQHQKITFKERLPLSKHEDIIIKPLGEPKPHSISTKGQAVWTLDLDAGQSYSLSFGYALTRPVKQ